MIFTLSAIAKSFSLGSKDGVTERMCAVMNYILHSLVLSCIMQREWPVELMLIKCHRNTFPVSRVALSQTDTLHLHYYWSHDEKGTALDNGLHLSGFVGSWSLCDSPMISLCGHSTPCLTIGCQGVFSICLFNTKHLTCWCENYDFRSIYFSSHPFRTISEYRKYVCIQRYTSVTQQKLRLRIPRCIFEWLWYFWWLNKWHTIDTYSLSAPVSCLSLCRQPIKQGLKKPNNNNNDDNDKCLVTTVNQWPAVGNHGNFIQSVGRNVKLI